MDQPLLLRLHPEVVLIKTPDGRSALRAYGDVPITAEQLGEFLFRTARVRGVIAADPARGRPYETSSRPYPSGGDAERFATATGIDPLVESSVGGFLLGSAPHPA